MNRLGFFAAQSTQAPISIHANSALTRGTLSTLPNRTISALSIGSAFAGRVVVALICGTRKNASISTISSVTIGGVSATIVAQGSHQSGTDYSGSAIAVAVVPSGTTADVVINWSGNSYYNCWAQTVALANCQSATAVDSGTNGITGPISGGNQVTANANTSSGGIILASCGVYHGVAGTPLDFNNSTSTQLGAQEDGQADEWGLTGYKLVTTGATNQAISMDVNNSSAYRAFITCASFR